MLCLFLVLYFQVTRSIKATKRLTIHGFHFFGKGV